MQIEVVYVRELESPDRRKLLGRFAAELKPDVWSVLDAAEDLSIDEAIAWGRERVGIVLVTFGRREGHLWSAGATPHWGYDPWPPPDLPRLIPREAPEADWRSREPGAEPIEWSVAAWLVPEDFDTRARRPVALAEALEGWDEAVAGAAAARRVHWDRRPMDLFLADLERSRRSGGGAGKLTTSSSPAYCMTLVTTSATAAGAEGEARSRLLLPAGFRATWTVHPADLALQAAAPPG